MFANFWKCVHFWKIPIVKYNGVSKCDHFSLNVFIFVQKVNIFFISLEKISFLELNKKFGHVFDAEIHALSNGDEFRAIPARLHDVWER